jgi:hypothetical protein
MFLILKDKACKLLFYRLQHFCFVDKRFEISNQSLFMGMVDIMRLAEISLISHDLGE